MYAVSSWIGGPIGENVDVGEWREKIEMGGMVASWALKIVDDLLAEGQFSLSMRLAISFHARLQ